MSQPQEPQPHAQPPSARSPVPATLAGRAAGECRCPVCSDLGLGLWSVPSQDGVSFPEAGRSPRLLQRTPPVAVSQAVLARGTLADTCGCQLGRSRPGGAGPPPRSPHAAQGAIHPQGRRRWEPQGPVGPRARPGVPSAGRAGGGAEAGPQSAPPRPLRTPSAPGAALGSAPPSGRPGAASGPRGHGLGVAKPGGGAGPRAGPGSQPVRVGRGPRRAQGGGGARVARAPRGGAGRLAALGAAVLGDQLPGQQDAAVQPLLLAGRGASALRRVRVPQPRSGPPRRPQVPAAPALAPRRRTTTPGMPRAPRRRFPQGHARLCAAPPPRAPSARGMCLAAGACLGPARRRWGPGLAEGSSSRRLMSESESGVGCAVSALQVLAARRGPGRWRVWSWGRPWGRPWGQVRRLGGRGESPGRCRRCRGPERGAARGVLGEPRGQRGCWGGWARPAGLQERRPRHLCCPPFSEPQGWRRQDGHRAERRADPARPSPPGTRPLSRMETGPGTGRFPALLSRGAQVFFVRVPSEQRV